MPNKIPVVLHAPSNRNVKGTKFILDAVQNLRNKGLLFEFVLIEGMSNAEARRHYMRADILVDQLLAGWYGGLAVELMALGKPVIAYIREQDLKFIPQEMADELPIIHGDPSNIEDVLESWITKEKSDLIEWGLKCRSYVERWHDPRKIAKKVCRDGYGIILK
jgi:glycosyltransferase involved in cell wall biosynthesis